jgi:putative ABC transport system permease protein
MKRYHISAGTSDWLVVGNQSFTASQISNAQLTASTSQLSIESRNDVPSGGTIINYATLFGIIIALGVLAMSVGLVRSETSSDLRTLAATGASSYTRRTLTAVTAGALGFLGALLGVGGGYIAMIGWLRSNSLNGGISALAHIPIRDLMLILFGMPAIAAIVGWLFASREPAVMGRQPIE